MLVMTKLPVDESLLIRTDFGDDAAWRSLCQAACAPSEEDGFHAHLICIDDPQFAGATMSTLRTRVPCGYFFVADARTFSDPERSILAVDNAEPESAHSELLTFRVIPSEVHGPENNLALGNMAFEEFADAADSDGVFRGFS